MKHIRLAFVFQYLAISILCGIVCTTGFSNVAWADAYAVAETAASQSESISITDEQGNAIERYPIPKAQYLANEKAAQSSAKLAVQSDGSRTATLFTQSVQSGATGSNNALTSQSAGTMSTQSVMTTQSTSSVPSGKKTVNGTPALDAARAYDGLPYVYGGRYPSAGGFDCAGLVMYCANQTVGTNYDLMMTDAEALYYQCIPISRVELQKGDLVFWCGTYDPDDGRGAGDLVNWISHVGFYAGNGKVYMAGDPIGEYGMSIPNVYGGEAKQLYARMLIDKPKISANLIEDRSSTYTGSECRPYSSSLNVKMGESWVGLKEGTDYTVTYKNNINAGTAKAIIQSKGSNCTGSATKTFTIKPKSLGTWEDTGTNTHWNSKNKNYYDGGPHEGWTLTNKVLNQDYTVSYKNNVKPGTATVIYTGIGNYTGKLYTKFTIYKGTNPWRFCYSSMRYVNYSKNKAKTFNLVTKTYKSAAGTKKFKKISGSKYLNVTSKGKLVLKKGAPRGTHTILVRYTATGNSYYKSCSWNLKNKIIVR